MMFVCTGGGKFESRRRLFCETEKKYRPFYVYEQAWYGSTLHCTGCGDSWQDGYRMARPFYRYWRKDAIAKARQQYAATPRRTTSQRKREWSAWLHEQLGWT